MTVGELIEELKKQNPEGHACVIYMDKPIVVQSVEQHIDDETNEPYTVLELAKRVVKH